MLEHASESLLAPLLYGLYKRTTITNDSRSYWAGSAGAFHILVLLAPRFLRNVWLSQCLRCVPFPYSDEESLICPSAIVALEVWTSVFSPSSGQPARSCWS